MKVRGIKRGQAIELVEALDIPNGTEVFIEVYDRQLSTSGISGKTSGVF